jgi:uncharacterized protein YjbJ (UPF0337 family)
MDWNTIEVMWKEAKRKVQSKWEKLTDEDLEIIGGRRDRLETQIHQRYGFAPNHVSKEVDDWVRWQVPKAFSRIRSQRSAIL